MNWATPQKSDHLSLQHSTFSGYINFYINLPPFIVQNLLHLILSRDNYIVLTNIFFNHPVAQLPQNRNSRQILAELIDNVTKSPTFLKKECTQTIPYNNLPAISHGYTCLATLEDHVIVCSSYYMLLSRYGFTSTFRTLNKIIDLAADALEIRNVHRIHMKLENNCKHGNKTTQKGRKHKIENCFSNKYCYLRYTVVALNSQNLPFYDRDISKALCQCPAETFFTPRLRPLDQMDLKSLLDFHKYNSKEEQKIHESYKQWLEELEEIFQ